MKIEKLTSEQESKLSQYRDKWLSIGLSTQPVTLERAIEIIHPLQTELLNRKETPVVLMDNPLHAWIAVCMLAQVVQEVDQQVVQQVVQQVDQQIRQEVERQVGQQVGQQIRQEVRQVGQQVEHEVWDQVGQEVEHEVGHEVWQEVKNFTWPWILGQFDAGLFSYYDFFLSETGVQVSDDLRRKFGIWKATSELGIVYPLEHICVVSQKPKAIHKNELGLHREGGMAVEYAGWGVYALNGVRVPEYLAMTPSESLDIQWYLKQENADVRTEFVRKYGVERMLHLGKQIDTHANYDEEWWTKSEYELWDMEALFPNLDYQPCLKMLNQTTGIWHVEAVSPACQTLPEAIKERFGGRDFTIAAIA